MSNLSDKIICQGLTYDCHIGFHDFEKSILQTLSLDIEAFIPARNPSLKDDPQTIVLDYFKAHHLIQKTLHHQEFQLIETVADRVAHLLLDNFAITAVTVRVTKKPLKLSNFQQVSYECHRSRSDL